MNGAFAGFQALDAQRLADLFGDVARLVVGEVVLAPELGGRGDKLFEVIWRFRFCGWSTHK